MKKRIMSMALCAMMLLSVLPLSAFSTGAEADAAACACTAACTEGAMNAECPVCSAEGATAAQCALHSHEPAAATQTAAQNAPVVTTPATPTATPDTPAVTPAAEPMATPEATPAPEVTPTAAPVDDAPAATPAPTPDAAPAPTLDEATAAAQAQIDALATAEELTALMTAMNDAEGSGDEAAYNAAAEQFGAACDSYATASAAYLALTPDQQALINPARLTAFEEFLNAFYATETLTGGNDDTDDNVAQIGETKYETLSAALDAATPGCTIKLLNNTDESDLRINNDDGTVTIDLNGHTFVPKSDVATGVTLDVSFVSATVAITGEGDLSNVTFKLNVGNSSTLDLSGWRGAPDTNDLTIAGLKIYGKNTEITLKDGLIFNKIEFVADTAISPSGQGEEQTGTGMSSSYQTFTAGDLLKNSGFKLVTVDGGKETDVLYHVTIGNDNNVYKVVKCTHTYVTYDNTSGKYSCQHCGQKMTVKVTVYTGTSKTFTYYTDIAEAFEYANGQSGCTVELLDDCTATASLTASGTFTLDLYGHTLTLNNGNGNLNVTGDLTITSSRKERDESSELNNGKINGTVNVADSAKLTVSNKVKGQTSGLETCTPEIAKLTVSGGDVKLSGGKFGSVEVSGGKLSVTNVTDGANVNGVRQETTCIPEISTLTVNGGDVKLSGGKYSEVYYNGNKLGDLLGDTEDAKYGFKYVKDGKTVWHDSTSKDTPLSLDSEALGISVEKLPIQSVTTDPANGETSIVFSEKLTLKITGINGGDLPNDARFRWYRRENGDEANLGSTEKVYSNNQYTSTSGKTEICCDVTVDGYTYTVKFDVTVNPKNLTEEDIKQISLPARADSVYEPELTNGVYNGDGIPKSLMTSVPTNNDDPLNLNKNGCIYEFKLAGEDEWKSAGDLKRSDAGEYEVYWRLNGKGRYTFNDKDCYECDTPIKAEIKPLPIESVTVDNPTKPYDGNTDLPTEAGKVTLNWTVSGPNGDETHSLVIGDGATGMVKLEFDTKDVGTGKTVTATLSENFKFADGATEMTAKNADGKTEIGTITPRELSIEAKDRQVAVGQPAPDLSNPKQGTDYELGDLGLVKGETLPGVLTLKYFDGDTEVKAPDTSKLGKEYTIRPEFEPTSSASAQPSLLARLGGTEFEVAEGIDAGNYLVKLQSGKLTVVNNFTITATADAGGAISPYGTVEVAPGASKTFAITPNPGYVIASVKVDGVNLGSIASYTFSNVDKNHTIHATFMLPWGNPQTGVDVG